VVVTAAHSVPTTNRKDDGRSSENSQAGEKGENEPQSRRELKGRCSLVKMGGGGKKSNLKIEGKKIRRGLGGGGFFQRFTCVTIEADENTMEKKKAAEKGYTTRGRGRGGGGAAA